MTTRTRAICTAVLALAGPPLAAAGSEVATPRRFGLGVVIGEPTGVTAKWFLDERQALDLTAAWSLSGRDAFHLHGDWLYHWMGAWEVSRGRWAPYVGIGARLRLREDEPDDDDDETFGVRVPAGVAYHLEPIPLEVFAEVGPTVDVAPDAEADLDVGVGARWYF